MTRFYSPGFIQNAVAGSLREYDLPDLAASLAPRKLLMINVKDGTGASQDQSRIIEGLSLIKSAYRLTGAERQLNILRSDSEDSLDELFMNRINNP